MKKFDFTTVINEAIDYLLLGEKSKLVFKDKLKLEYSITKDALLEIVKEMADGIVIIADKSLEDVAVALVVEAKQEAKLFMEERKELFTEVCKKRAKKRLKEANDLKSVSEETVNEIATEVAGLFMTLFPIVLENNLEMTVDNEIKVNAYKSLFRELQNIARKVKTPCCGG